MISAFFLVSWTVDPGSNVVVEEGIVLNFASPLFESSLAFLEVGAEVLGTDDGDEDS